MYNPSPMASRSERLCALILEQAILLMERLEKKASPGIGRAILLSLVAFIYIAVTHQFEQRFRYRKVDAPWLKAPRPRTAYDQISENANADD